MSGIHNWHCPGCDRPMKKVGLLSLFASAQNPEQVYPYALCTHCAKKVTGQPSRKDQAFFTSFEGRLIDNPHRYGTAATSANQGVAPLDKANPKLAALFKQLANSASKRSVAK